MLNKLYVISLLLLLSLGGAAQLAPGGLVRAHEHLEGLSNCTKCHTVGEKVSNQKCLDCHDEIDQLIKQGRGYHVSIEVYGKECVSCHSDHHGRDFQIIKLDQENFNHELTGYSLKGAHADVECNDCHNSINISNPISQKTTEGTFLGLGTDCLSCHDDYHQNTLSGNCTSCHNLESFAPAVHFDHQQTDFPLEAKHANADCVDCHEMLEKDGRQFQQFAGTDFQNCTSCHEDVHENKFGQDCQQCHTVQSFREIIDIERLNHDNTNFPLQGLHETVGCKSCHRNSYIEPLAHSQCSDCHSDQHRGQFKNENPGSDCSDCHTVHGFSPSTYTIEKHNHTLFSLEEAHLATPCFACHQKNERWEFRDIGVKCIDCHENIHEGFISKQFMAENNCENCHSTSSWIDISFDHQQTGFVLEGKHAEITCRDCHFVQVGDGTFNQRFNDLQNQCIACHEEQHKGQFEKRYKNDCSQCHGFDTWNASRFNHDNSRFKLEGKHLELDCIKCHPLVGKPTDRFIRYKLFKEIKCTNCHS